MICLRYLCAALLLVCLVVVTCEASPQRFFRGGGGFHRGGGGFHRGGGGFHRGGGGFHRGGGFAQPQFFRGGFRGRPHFFGGGFSAEVGGQNSFEFFG